MTNRFVCYDYNELGFDGPSRRNSRSQRKDWASALVDPIPQEQLRSLHLGFSGGDEVSDGDFSPIQYPLSSLELN
jgi:hypothetical protein